MPENNGLATLTEVRNYFGMKTSDFAAEWRTMPDKDKNELRSGIGNGSLNY